MKKAFTLVELLVVIGIIAVLAAFLVPAISGSSDSAKAAKCLSNMRQIAVGAQAYAMSTGSYPLAGTVEEYKTLYEEDGTRAHHGWIGWSEDSPSGSYISPYSISKEARYYSLTNGTVWKAVSKSRDVFVCPIHREKTRKALGPSDKYGPLWSYVMNANFGWNSTTEPRDKGFSGVVFVHDPAQTENYLRNPSKTLMIAELPFVQNSFQTSPQYSASASQENDPILQYLNCEGGGEEIIGFNHKIGKRDWFGHVCFADGHTEKFKLPRGATQENLKNLTYWLCDPMADDITENKKRIVRDFEVILRSSGGNEKYEKDNKTN